MREKKISILWNKLVNVPDILVMRYYSLVFPDDTDNQNIVC